VIATEERKVIGPKGLVTLPKAFRDYWGLSAGDTVTLAYDDVVVVFPGKVEMDTKVAERVGRAIKELSQIRRYGK